MAVSSGDTITAAQYNNLQSRIAQVLGVGSVDFGYGQAVTSTQVLALQDPTIPDGDSVLAAQLNNLRSDLGTAYTHQEGTVIPINIFAAGDIIGADQSGDDLDYATNGSFTFVNPDASKGFNDFLDIMTDLETNRFVLHPSQSEEQVLEQDFRTTNWNGSIDSEFTVSFASADDRRHFFNAGGEVRIEGTVDLSTSTGDSLARDEGWNDLIENPGQIQFNYNSTTITGSTTGVTFPAGVIGNDGLTSSYQVIFKKDANGGIYGNSYWQIEAKENSSTVISFRLFLQDDGPESDTDAGDPGSIPGGIVEPVSARIDFDYAGLKASGTVVVPFPAYNVTNTFE